MSESQLGHIQTKTQLLESTVADICFDIIAPCPDHICISDIGVAYDSARRTVTGAVYQALARVARSLNGRGPASRLPRELLCAVFEFLPLRDRVYATHVCQYWRTTALDTPSLWATIVDLKRPLGPAGLSTVVARSGSCDLRLSLSAVQRNYQDVCRCLKESLHRCVDLEVEILCFGPGSARALSRALCTPAPKLRSFKLWDAAGEYNDRSGNKVDLFSGHAPHLELLKLYTAIYNVRPSKMFHSVKRFMYCSSVPSVSSVLETLFTCLPNVEVLCIELQATDGDQAKWLPREIPPSVKELRVISGEGLSLASFFSHVSVRPGVRLRAHYRDPPSEDEAVAVLRHLMKLDPQQRLELQAFTSSHEEHTADLAIWVDKSDVANDTDEWTTRLYNFPRNALPMKQMFQQMTQLSLDELLFSAEYPLPAAPNLTELTICLLPRARHDMYSEHTLFLLPITTPQLRFFCPNLRILGLSATERACLDSAGRLTYVSADLVHTFITSHLAFDGLRLQELQLLNIELVWRTVDEIADLLGLVGDVKTVEPLASNASNFFDELSDWNFANDDRSEN